MIIFCSILTMLLIFMLVLLPFLVGRGGQLSKTSLIYDVEECSALKKRILEQFVKEEKSFQEGSITSFEWAKRQTFLRGRYLDIARRIDFLKNSSLILLLLGTLSFFYSTPSNAAPSLSGRHIVILQGDRETLWGSYYFAVQNPEKTPQEFTVPIALPKEATDFQPQDGLLPKDVVLLDDGKVRIKKTFKPGMNLSAIGFKVPLGSADPVLTFTAGVSFDEFSVATSTTSGLSIHSPDSRFDRTLPHMLTAEGQWTGLTSKGPIAAGESFEFSVQGFPPYFKLTLWILGISFGLLLLLCAFVLVYAGRKRVEMEDRSSAHVAL